MTRPTDAKPDSAEFQADRVKFTAAYAAMADYELLNLKEQIATLKPGAKAALQGEISRRDFSKWSQEPPLPNPCKGVRGWLRFFVVDLYLFAFGAVSTLALAADLGTELLHASWPWLLLGALEAGCLLVLAGTAFSVASKLRKVRPDAVRSAKRFLWAMSLYAIAAAVVFLVAGSLAHSDPPMFIFVSSFQPLSYIPWAILGYFYLRRSRRVAATYGTAPTE